LKSGPSGGYLGQPKAVLKKGIVSEDHAYHLAMAEILENREQIIRDGGLFMTFTSDPMTDVCRDLFLKICIGSIQYKTPVVVLTKATKFWYSDNYFNLRTISKFGFQPERYVCFGWTLTGHDELEPNAPFNENRLRDMEIVHDEGFKTWASIEPVIDFPSSLDMIYQALDAGCEHFKIGLMTKNTKVCRHGFTLGGKTFEPYDLAECCQFVDYVMKLTEGRATVYWKQSVADFLGQSEKDPQPVHGMTAREFLSQWPHSVSKDWSIFAPSPSVQYAAVPQQPQYKKKGTTI
jgi:hypothetical protein